MKKLLIATWIAASTSMVWASCTYSTYSANGRIVSCTTCCYGNNCNTSCY